MTNSRLKSSIRPIISHLFMIGCIAWDFQNNSLLYKYRHDHRVPTPGGHDSYRAIFPGGIRRVDFFIAPQMGGPAPPDRVLADPPPLAMPALILVLRKPCPCELVPTGFGNGIEGTPSVIRLNCKHLPNSAIV